MPWTALAIQMVAILVLAAPAVAVENCPVSDRTKVPALLKNASSCDRSYAIFEACSYAASGDVELGAIVTEKCEAAFLAKLSKKHKQAYDREQKRCASKYAKESGTMYRSFEAFCGAEVARKYARRFAKAPKGKR